MTSSKMTSSNDEILKLSPWNENNVLLKQDDIYYIFERCGFKNVRNTIKINDLSLYQTAFVHSSYTRNLQQTNNEDRKIEISEKPSGTIDLFDKDYEDMEFLGDRCLDLSIAFYLYRMYPNTDPGFKTNMKAKLVRKESLASFANFLGLSKYLIISKHVEEKTDKGRKNPRILEDVMEAFFCAIFLDQNKNNSYYSPKMKELTRFRLSGPGWLIVNGFIENLLEQCVDWEELVMSQENYKEKLLQFYQKEFKITPKYLELNIEGPPHQRIFTMGVLDKDGNIVGRDVATTKRQAEQLASKNALEYFAEMTDNLGEMDMLVNNYNDLKIT